MGKDRGKKDIPSLPPSILQPPPPALGEGAPFIEDQDVDVIAQQEGEPPGAPKGGAEAGEA
jgi:hypothetical protein